MVEAICIRLTDAITQPRVNAPGGYASRWKLVISAFNQIRGRLNNSQLLTEQTDLALYHINETTLTKWSVQYRLSSYNNLIRFLFHVLIF